MLDRFFKILCHVSGGVLLASLAATFLYPDYFGIHLVGVPTPALALLPLSVYTWMVAAIVQAVWMARYGRAPLVPSILSLVLLIIVMAFCSDHVLQPGPGEHGKVFLLSLFLIIAVFAGTGAPISWESKKKRATALNA
jgi:hypothetical protein